MFRLGNMLLVGSRSVRRRRGVVLLIAILLLIITSTMSVGIISSMARRHRQLRRHQHELQAVWLAESALERSAAMLQEDSSYAGEMWRLPSSEMAGEYGAAVNIRVASIPGRPRRYAVRVIADYPESPPHRIRYSKEVLIDLPANGDSS